MRPRSTFPTRELTKPTGDNMKILRGESHKLIVLIFKKTRTYILIYVHIHARLNQKHIGGLVKLNC